MIVHISKSQDDHAALQRAAGALGLPAVMAPDMDRAWEQIRKTRARLVICDADIDDGGWRRLVDNRGEDDFEIVVASRLPTECFWAEVLNLGAYDLLALPFDSEELQRVLSAALRQHQTGHTAGELPRRMPKARQRRRPAKSKHGS